MMNKISLVAMFMMLAISGFAQSSSLEGTFYQSGKFYVVVFVVAVILLGIFGYLFSMDRKIKKLEDRLKD